MPSLATSNAGAQFESYRHACADQLRDLLGAPGKSLLMGLPLGMLLPVAASQAYWHVITALHRE